MSAAVFSALQTFLLLPELAERHRQAALALGRLRHRVETVLVAEHSAITAEVLNDISKEWDALLLEVRPVPQRLYRRVESEVLSQKARSAN